MSGDDEVRLAHEDIQVLKAIAERHNVPGHLLLASVYSLLVEHSPNERITVYDVVRESLTKPGTDKITHSQMASWFHAELVLNALKIPFDMKFQELQRKLLAPQTPTDPPA